MLSFRFLVGFVAVALLATPWALAPGAQAQSLAEFTVDVEVLGPVEPLQRQGTNDVLVRVNIVCERWSPELAGFRAQFRNVVELVEAPSAEPVRLLWDVNSSIAVSPDDCVNGVPLGYEFDFRLDFPMGYPGLRTISFRVNVTAHEAVGAGSTMWETLTPIDGDVWLDPLRRQRVELGSDATFRVLASNFANHDVLVTISRNSSTSPRLQFDTMTFGPIRVDQRPDLKVPFRLDRSFFNLEHDVVMDMEVVGVGDINLTIKTISDRFLLEPRDSTAAPVVRLGLTFLGLLVVIGFGLWGIRRSSL